MQNTRILAVDTAPAMLEVMKNFAVRTGYEFEGYSDPADAQELLQARLARQTCDFRCVMLGWPQGDAAIIDGLVDLLMSVDDLPVVIVCEQGEAGANKLAKKRSHTNVVLWSQYQQAADIIDRMPVVDVAARAARYEQGSEPQPAPENETASAPLTQSEKPSQCVRALLVDRAPSVVNTLKRMMESSGYSVTAVRSVAQASARLEAERFDLVVTDYQLHQQEDSTGLSAFQSLVCAHGEAPMVIVLAARYSDSVVAEVLNAGAVACLFKNESIDLIFARIRALSRSLPLKVDRQLPAEQDADTVDESAVASNGPEAVEPTGEPAQQTEQAETPEPKVSAGSITAARFKEELGATLVKVAGGQHDGIRYSVLLLDVQIEAATGDRMSLGDSEPMCRIVEDALARLYKRPESLAYLGNGQFALLFASCKLQDTLMLVRKVLQVVPRMVRYLNNMTLVSHAALVRIDGANTGAEAFLTQCRTTVARTRKDRRDNCALVMPLKKYLSAIEARENSIAEATD
ncbi:MAG: response regulator [Pseudomonadota bacterium]